MTPTPTPTHIQPYKAQTDVHTETYTLRRKQRRLLLSLMSVSAGRRFRIRWSFTKCPPHPPPHLTAITLQMSLPQIQKYTIYRQHKAAAGRTHTHTKKKV